MEEELNNFLLVWVSAIISVSYCFYIPTRIKAGVFRLLFVLPVCGLFSILPLFFSSVHFSSSTAFYLSGISNLKPILFAFDQGPLFPIPPYLTHFVCFSCFPIKLQQNPKSHPPQNHFHKWGLAFKFSSLVLCYMCIVIVTFFLLMCYWVFVSFIYTWNLRFSYPPLKNLLSKTLECDLEPQFDEPYLAISLQDFWGRRWNLMVSAILKSGIYIPVRSACQCLMSSGWARFLGYVVTFLVSGLFHELVYFYTRETPKWEVTLFFLIHGFCTGMEVAMKKTTFMVRWWQVRPAVSGLLTMGFLVMTVGWLFFPQFVRSGMMERRANETLFLFDFFNRKFPIFWS